MVRTAELHDELTAVLGASMAPGDARREVRWILEAVGDPRTARTLAARRAAGEPLQYVLGTWPFRSFEVAVDPRVLVPRPETEQVAAVALDVLARIAAGSPGAPLVATDLGTGSGVLALSLALEGPAALDVWATDVSAEALEVAAGNLARLRQRRGDPLSVHLALGSWFEALPDALGAKVHLAVSNPPYVSEAEWLELDPVVRDHEPRGALVAGDSGRECLDVLLVGARRFLAPGGALVLELAPHQERWALDRAAELGYRHARVTPDLSGRPRVLAAHVAEARA